MTISSTSTLTEVAVAVASALSQAGIDAVLTGGACATAYSEGAYVSHDLDFIVRSGGTRRDLNAAMGTAGFHRDGDRYAHPDSMFFVEFPRGPLAIGDDLDIQPVRLSISGGSVMALSATDACRDRLAAFFHWTDRQSFAAAVAIARVAQVDMAVIQQWSSDEGFRERFEEFRDALAKT